jgi:hypothetical protein
MFGLARAAYATNVPLGFHLLEPNEIDFVLPYKTMSEQVYVTVPMVMTDRRVDVWERFFKTCDENNIIPLVRWVTVFRDGSWSIPTRKEIVELMQFMKTLRWPGRRVIVLFNEPNQAKEWGGRIDPEGYAELASFAASWLKTDGNGYEVLPAGLDAAAPNNHVMLDSIRYIERMYKASPELFELLDGWTSHAYPNPDFSASAYRTGKNSLRGYEMEIATLKRLTKKDFSVYITETGWRQSKQVNRQLLSYYKYAVAHIWSDSRVKAVTFFVFRGVSGPFADFSFLDGQNKPTILLSALLDAIKFKH